MSELKLYEYSVIRFVPDVEREEFINVGVIMMCKRSRWIKIRIAMSLDRFRLLKSNMDYDAVVESLNQFRRIAEGDYKNGGPIAALDVEERFRWLSAVKSSCLQFSRPHPGLADNLESQFDKIYTRMVE